MSQEPNVKSIPVTDASGKAARITVSTDIVDYMASARVFGQEDLAQAGAHGRFQKRMIAMPDRRTSVVAPMVLSIGSNNGLYLVRRQEGSGDAGWTRTDLAPSLKKFGLASVQVRAMGAAWSDDDRIALAVAVDSGDASSASRVFVAFDVSSKSDWEKLAWVDCGTRESVRVHGIRVLRELDGSWTVVLDGDAQRVDMLYLIRSTRAPSFADALVFNPAVDYQEILDFEVAVDEISGSGIAVLGVSGATRVLSFRPFPDYRAPQPSNPPVIPLPCPDGANVIESGVTGPKGTDLYIGGKGIHLLPATEFYEQDDATLVTVESAEGFEAGREVQEIVVADAADGTASVWARRANGELVFVNRAAGGKWSTPLKLRDRVQTIAAVPGGQLVTSSLLVVYTDGRASFLLRDATGGTWRESPLLVSNPDSVVKATCYGTAVRLMDNGNAPRVKVPVKVSASVLASVNVNGQNVFVGPGLEIPVETDVQGAVRIYDRVRSLTPAVYRLTIDGIGGSVDVNPAGSVYERFSKMTADDLRKAKVPLAKGGEEPLLPAEFRDGARSGEVDGMAGALRQTADLAGATANATVTGARMVKAGAGFSSDVRLDAKPAGYRWGIQAGPGGVRSADPSVMDSLIAAGQSAGQFFSDLGDSLADFFEGVKTRVQEGWTFIVRKAEEAFEFICALGNKVKKFVLDTLEQIGSFFTWLWSEIKTGLEKVWEFLKFVFNWDDILMARDVLVSVVSEGLNHMKATTKTMREKTIEGFNSAIAQVEVWRKDVGLPPAKLKPPPEGQSFADSSRDAGPDGQKKVDQSTGNSVTGWVFEKINEFFDQIIHIEGPNPGDIAFHAVQTFVTGVVKDQLDNLINMFEQVKADIKRLFDDKMPGVSDLNFDTIKTLLVALGSNVVIGFLTALRDLAARAIDLMGEIVEVIRAALFAKVSFPFIEKLVELVSPGTKIDTSFRAVDALMLLVAVPATITYKLIFGQAPFKKGDSVDFPFGRVAVQELTLDELKKFGMGMIPFVGIGVALIKTVLGYYFMGTAMAGEFAGSNKGIVLGLIFGGLGVIAQMVSVRWKEGSTVTALEYACYGASALSFLVTIAMSDQKWNNHGDIVTPTAHRIEAVFDIFTTTAQIVMGAVVFGFVASNVVNATTDYNRHRILPETFSWIASLLDQAGSVTTSAACFISVDPAKTILIGCSAIGKTAATAFKVLEVVALKTVTEKFQTATA